MIDAIRNLRDLIQCLFTTSGVHGYQREKALQDIGGSLAEGKKVHLILSLLRAPDEKTGNQTRGETALLMLYELFWYGWDPIEPYLGKHCSGILTALTALISRQKPTPRQLLAAVSLAPALLRNFAPNEEVKFAFLEALDNSQIDTYSDAADLREECRKLIVGTL